MKKTHDLAVVTGTYQKDGQTKKRYQNVGVMLEGDNGPFILLDKTFNPAGIEGRDGRISISLFVPKNEQRPAYDQSPARDDYDDAIPF